MPIEYLQPGRWPGGSVYPAEAGVLIEQLRRFIGHDSLVAQTKRYRGVEDVSNGVRLVRMREQQPLIEAFEDYERATWHRRRPLRAAIGAIPDLAHVAAHFQVVNPTLKGSVRENHRSRLINLNGQLKPLLLEWKTASHFGKANNSEIAWLPVDQTGPEFIVRSDGLEWETECKRQSRMIAELVGQNETDQLAGLIFSRLATLNLCGNVKVTIPLEFDARILADQAAWIEALQVITTGGDQEHALLGGAVMEAELRERNGLTIPASEWEGQLRAQKLGEARLYASAGARNDLAVDPVALQILAPRRNGEQLVQYLWERKFNRAAGQCTGNRAAVLVFEWEDVDDPRIFSESEGVQALLHRTFDEHRHVAAIVMRCDGAPSRLDGMIDYAVGAYAARSEVTNFRDVAQRIQLFTREP